MRRQATRRKAPRQAHRSFRPFSGPEEDSRDGGGGDGPDEEWGRSIQSSVCEQRVLWLRLDRPRKAMACCTRFGFGSTGHERRWPVLQGLAARQAAEGNGLLYKFWRLDRPRKADGLSPTRFGGSTGHERRWPVVQGLAARQATKGDGLLSKVWRLDRPRKAMACCTRFGGSTGHGRRWPVLQGVGVTSSFPSRCLACRRSCGIGRAWQRLATGRAECVPR